MKPERLAHLASIRPLAARMAQFTRRTGVAPSHAANIGFGKKRDKG